MCFFYVPAIAHAWRTVTTYEEEARNKKVINEIRALQEPLLLQAQTQALVAQAGNFAVAPRRRRLRASEPEPEPEIDDPYIGTGGKVFRRRR